MGSFFSLIKNPRLYVHSRKVGNFLGLDKLIASLCVQLVVVHFKVLVKVKAH